MICTDKDREIRLISTILEDCRHLESSRHRHAWWRVLEYKLRSIILSKDTSYFKSTCTIVLFLVDAGYYNLYNFILIFVVIETA